MKTFLMTMTFFMAFSAFACPDLSGKYQCGQDGKLELKYDAEKSTYTMVAGKSVLSFAVGGWAGIEQAADRELDTKAECAFEGVQLFARETITGMDQMRYFSSTVRYEITANETGIAMDLFASDKFVKAMSCTKM